jgi:hypothetical protein
VTTRGTFQQTAVNRLRAIGRAWRGAAKRLPRTTRGRIVLALCSLAVVVLMVIFTLLFISRLTPSYWQRNEKLLASDNATLLQLSNQFEQQALRDLSGSQDEPASTTRTIHVSFEQLNAWLSIKLEDFLANRKMKLPPQIRHPMLAGEEGYLVVAFDYHTDHVDQVISLRLEPVFDDTGKRFRLQLLGARAGVLPLPVDTLRKRLSDQSPQIKAKIDKVFDMLGSQWLEAVQHHPGDARQNLRLTGIHITEEGLDLTLRSEPRQP